MRQQSVAIIGASSDRSKFGNKAVRAFIHKRWKVYPVHPTAGNIENVPAFESVSKIPEKPDWISVYVNQKILRQLLPEIAKIGCQQLWLNPGTDSDEIVLEAENLGLSVKRGCSIVAIGVSPSSLDSQSQ